MVCSTGLVSGLPQAHFTRGVPYWSTSTAVPDCSTAWRGVALPFLNPWLVTRVSRSSTTGVSSDRYCPTCAVVTFDPPLHARVGSALRASTQAFALEGLSAR